MVSAEDRSLLSARAWCAAVRNQTVYAQATLCQARIYLHRMIDPFAQEIDHINGWGLDNRRQNLRAASRTENSRNTRPKRTKDRSSRFKGVHWNKKDRRWVAQIANREGKTLHLGHFKSEEDAARIYDLAAREYHGEFAFLNFRDDSHAA